MNARTEAVGGAPHFYHEAREARRNGQGTAFEPSRWGCRSSSIKGAERMTGVPIWAGEPHGGLQWDSLWDNETFEACAEMGGESHAILRFWGLRWSSLWGDEMYEG